MKSISMYGMGLGKGAAQAVIENSQGDQSWRPLAGSMNHLLALKDASHHCLTNNSELDRLLVYTSKGCASQSGMMSWEA